jgi:AcrR family transcriptional regulator
VTAQFPFNSRVNRHEHQRAKTHALLFEAAIQEYRRVGFERASVARIARDAGVSRPSFYFHFPSKQHVLLELQWKLEIELAERFQDCETLRETLNELIEGLIDTEHKLGSAELFRDMLRIYTRHSDSLPVGDQPFPLYFALGRAFAGAASRGELREGLDPARACHLCLTSVFGYLIATPGLGEEGRDDLRILFSLYINDTEQPG